MRVLATYIVGTVPAGRRTLSWLVFGLEKVDPKLRRIAFLNEKLAYRPWSISKEDFAFLIKEGDKPAENW